MRSRVEELFHEVADLPEEARARYLAERGIDAATRSELDALLAFDSRNSVSLDRNIGEVAQGALERLESKDIPCGPYRLGEVLGRGGMGTVHLADRVDGEIAHRVAVKLLRPGADDPRLRQRFLAERQILASLSHPNIARLLDAGHREDGQPYLVMEYIAGKTIDVYAAGMGVRQTIALFLKVCAAVSYLHRNLVVHRDLKPSNIMVTEDGEPKLLDFGIAKMLDWTGDSTVTGMRMLTPDYASPEQVCGSPVSTASDIYSLGAVLYHLLTGASPHRFDGDTAGSIVRSISSASIAAPATLAPGLKGDVEMLLMKALRKEPEERYATIEQFSEDLESYLQSRPIRARKTERWYQARKFLRRHWLPAAAATLAIGGLSAGVLVANYERTIAQRRFVQVRQLANQLFDIDLEVRRASGSTKVREMIAGTAVEYLGRLARDVHGDPDLALELGNAYLRVARVQGVPIAANLGHADQAERSLQMAGDLLSTVLSARPANRTAMLRTAQVEHDRMVLAGNRVAPDEALAHARRSTEWVRKYESTGSIEPAEADAIAVVYMNVGGRFVLAKEYDEAIRVCRRAIEVARAAGIETQAGAAMMSVAEAHRQKGELEDALRTIQESARILEPPPGPVNSARSFSFVNALSRQGQILGDDQGISMGRSGEALRVLERAFALAEENLQRDAEDASGRSYIATVGIVYAGILRHSDPRRAAAVYDEALSRISLNRDNPRSRRQEIRLLAGSSYALRRLGRKPEARKRIDAALERLGHLKLYPAEQIRPGSEADEALSALADYEAEQKNPAHAVEIYSQLLLKVAASKPEADTSLGDAYHLSRLYRALAGVCRQAHQYDRAAFEEGRRLELWKRWDAKLPHNAFVSRQLAAASGAATWAPSASE